MVRDCLLVPLYILEAQCTDADRLLYCLRLRLASVVERLAVVTHRGNEDSGTHRSAIHASEAS
jgi:hypothetical protein